MVKRKAVKALKPLFATSVAAFALNWQISVFISVFCYLRKAMLFEPLPTQKIRKFCAMLESTMS